MVYSGYGAKVEVGERYTEVQALVSDRVSVLFSIAFYSIVTSEVGNAFSHKLGGEGTAFPCVLFHFHHLRCR